MIFPSGLKWKTSTPSQPNLLPMVKLCGEQNSSYRPEVLALAHHPRPTFAEFLEDRVMRERRVDHATCF